MTIHIETANAFTTTCRKLGVIKPNIGLHGLRDLIQLSKAPSPARPVTPTISNTRYSKLRHVGLLISNGLAVFNRQHSHYEITDEGRQWLVDLQAHGIISPH
jgi:hypothetical protein